MIFFRNDYGTGCHPRILEALSKTNMEQTDGYGLDEFCVEAANLIKKSIGREDVFIHFIPGGTQCNVLGLSSFIKPHHAIIAPNTSHVQMHETGAIESTGHKIWLTDSPDGKLYPEDIDSIMDSHEDEHMALPKLVCISFPTELGSLYSKDEVIAIRKICDKYNLLLYIDGARMSAGLGASSNDLDLNFISNTVDAFYIGGTKNGTMIGEAFVICNPDLNEDFRYMIKLRGALLAKGRLMGVQFAELFKDDLFFQLGSHASNMGKMLTSKLQSIGVEFLIDSPTNQVFPILPISIVEELEKDFFFMRWKKISDEKWAVRFVTSWATKEDDVESLYNRLKMLI